MFPVCFHSVITNISLELYKGICIVYALSNIKIIYILLEEYNKIILHILIII